MALVSSHATSFGQRFVADVGRCGLSSDYQQRLVSTAEAAVQAGHRLLGAAAHGDVTSAARCVADGADPNFEDPANGETGLHRAAQRNQAALVEVLASLGADMDRPDRAGRTPLYVAASRGFIDTVSKLLSHGASLFPPETRSLPSSRRPCSTSCSCSGTCRCAPSAGPSTRPSHHNPTDPSSSSPTTDPTHIISPGDDDEEAALLALRATCPLAAAAAAARWPLVAALLAALPPDFPARPPALRSLRFLVWALASHRAFPPAVIAAVPPRLPPCVLDAVRPAHLASTPLVLATGNDQQQLMQWLLARGADPELGAPLLLCAGRFCRGSRTCCVSTLLRRGAAPHVAWADQPSDSPLALAAAGDCFSHVHVLVAFGADVGGEAARVRQALYAPAAWEEHLDGLMEQCGGSLAAAAGPGAEALLCPCGQQHARWPGLWPQDGEAVVAEVELEEEEVEEEREAGAGGNSCHNRTPADDAWYRRHCAQMEQLQDGTELAECRKAVDELWRYGCSAVVSELGGAPSAPYSLLPQRVLAAMQDVAGGWLAAAARCRAQRQLRADLYDKAVAAGRALLDRKRVAALAALSGAGRGGGAGSAAAPSCSNERKDDEDDEEEKVEEEQAAGSSGAGSVEAQERQPRQGRSLRPSSEGGGLVGELRMEILALAGLAPPGVEPRALSRPARAACGCQGCRG
ncbi:hypothetical protein PLESTB_001205500 [Pleodorina starrii]|uniref:Uncharacterized protein n=1 Tax=Pleodorina starrii TaxID=330485 RepID=A0A9W6BS72_9CHLO|nr:hypothetical protein PLESTM_001748700 [Pleodorina starrii]GLC57264.1 hypothetical protein PLESTB_001205500 [Pleodorina starrii]GLC71345.1 hypothetical protein PLESTF_001105400 [Pleodorina starrii]